MNDSGHGKGHGSRVSNGKRSKDEWTKIVDRVEAAILISLANKVLAEAVVRQNEIDEHRKQLKLVELKNFSRRTYAG